MYSYTIVQWLFFFYFYCFFGWCFESCYVSLKKKKLVNRGFMRGPFLPLYGSGAIMMLLVSSPFQENLFMVYVAGCIGATALEFTTGVTMEALFKVRYWDYSNLPLNFQGHICLGSSLAWGFLTLLMTEVIHKPVEKLVYAIPGIVLVVVTALLTVLIAADFILSFKAALDLRDILDKMEKTREEFTRMLRRLDVILAVADDELTAKKTAITETLEQKREELTERLRMEELKAGIEERLESIKDSLPVEYLENVKEEIAQVRQKLRTHSENKEKLGGIRNFYKRNMIRSNPTMYSVKFRGAFEELKAAAEEHTKKRNKEKEENTEKNEKET